MRVCFITVGNTERLAGGAIYQREVFARLRAAGATVEQIVASEAPVAAQLAAITELGGRVNPRHYDCILVDALARAAAAPWIDQWRARRPLVVLAHKLPSLAAGPIADAQELAWEAALLRADWLVATSRHGADLLVERGANRARVLVAAGGCDRLGGPAAPPAPHAPGAGVSALCVAQWTRRKGLLELVRAWHEAARPGDRLELIGEAGADPAYASEVRAAIGAAGGGAGILTRGAVSDAELRMAYDAADLFALPSRYAGYGMAVAEALAHGLPVLACAVGPLPELVGTEAGMLVPPGDGPALAAALRRLLSDDALRARMGVAALERARALPTWDDTASLLLNALGAAVVGRTAQ